MKLVDPKGTRISVSDELGERLLKLAGYRRTDGPPVAPATPSRRKTAKEK